MSTSFETALHQVCASLPDCDPSMLQAMFFKKGEEDSISMLSPMAFPHKSRATEIDPYDMTMLPFATTQELALGGYNEVDQMFNSLVCPNLTIPTAPELVQYELPLSAASLPQRYAGVGAPPPLIKSTGIKRRRKKVKRKSSDPEVLRQASKEEGKHIGIYGPIARAARLERHRKKRLRRDFTQIRYACRKTICQRRVRVNGRFLKRKAGEAPTTAHRVGIANIKNPSTIIGVPTSDSEGSPISINEQLNFSVTPPSSTPSSPVKV